MIPLKGLLYQDGGVETRHFDPRDFVGEKPSTFCVRGTNPNLGNVRQSFHTGTIFVLNLQKNIDHKLLVNRKLHIDSQMSC